MKPETKRITIGIVAAIVVFATFVVIQNLSQKDQRFVEVKRYRGNSINEAVLLDTETGVYYLFIAEKGYNGKSAMTPLLDSTGKPISLAQSEAQTAAPTLTLASPAEQSPSPTPVSSSVPVPTPSPIPVSTPDVTPTPPSSSPDPTPVQNSTPTPAPSPSPFWDYSSEEAQEDFENFLQATLDFLRECEELRDERLGKESESQHDKP